jgi:hypothetical protein
LQTIEFEFGTFEFEFENPDHPCFTRKFIYPPPQTTPLAVLRRDLSIWTIIIAMVAFGVREIEFRNLGFEFEKLSFEFAN